MHGHPQTTGPAPSSNHIHVPEGSVVVPLSYFVLLSEAYYKQHGTVNPPQNLGNIPDETISQPDLEDLVSYASDGSSAPPGYTPLTDDEEPSDADDAPDSPDQEG